jgi:hypothetical protein
MNKQPIETPARRPSRCQHRLNVTISFRWLFDHPAALPIDLGIRILFYFITAMVLEAQTTYIASIASGNAHRSHIFWLEISHPSPSSHVYDDYAAYYVRKTP